MSRSRYATALVIGSVALLNSARQARTHRVSADEEHIFRPANDLPDAIHIPVWAVMQSGSRHRDRRLSFRLRPVHGRSGESV